jgi:multiple sugar transport system substrate-binding protein
MQELEFSVMAANEDGIRPLLEQFEAEQNIHVRLRLLAWDSAWSMFVRAALYNDGPDVSEIGTTWIGDLVGMNGLRPFQAAEVAGLGRASAFIPVSWKTVFSYGDSNVWAIPWLAGARLLLYRHDLLERAGVDEQVAFQTNESLEKALHQLQACGVQVPWTVPTGYTHTSLLNCASWVWAAGGDFLSNDGRKTRFLEPESLAGLRAYFRLGRYIPPEARRLNGLEPDELFISNPDTAMTMSGPWLYCEAYQRLGEDLAGEIRLALPPGPSFVGGSNLVIWKYCRQPEAALKLIRFLTQKPAQVAYCQRVGLLPARVKALQEELFTADPWQTAARGLASGRSFPTIRLWGLVEDRLTAVLNAIWNDVLAGQEQELDEILQRHLEPLAQRLDPLLLQG